MTIAAPIERHIPILDFWRALSITLVLCGHLLPLGPSALRLNGAVAAAGMAVFFILSGFLITRFLIEDGNVRRFLIRRIARILPLAWLGMLLAMLLVGGRADQLASHLVFASNLPPFLVLPAGSHFWSLSLEVQFYLFVSLLVALGGKRCLILLPIIALCVTAGRIGTGTYISIVTWLRIDEILVGSAIALTYEGRFGQRPKIVLAKLSPVLLMPVLIASAHPAFGPLNYARPYIAAVMVGASIYNAPVWMRSLSTWKPVIYVATISYGIYVFHGIFMDWWLGSGDTLVKYAKRPLLIIATFVCATLSFRYFERPLVRWAKARDGSAKTGWTERAA